MEKMFCYQCEQTVNGTGCTRLGVCGKQPDTAAMQDLTVYAAKGVSQYAHRARLLGEIDPEIDHAVIEGLFTAVTNVNFDTPRIERVVRHLAQLKERARQLYERAADKAGQEPEELSGPASWQPASDTDGLLRQAKGVGIEQRKMENGDDVTGLQELLTYGLKGAAAYTDHAHILGRDDQEIYGFFHHALSYLADNPQDITELTAMALLCGEINLKVMGELNRAHTETFGHPQPTPVRIDPVKGKAIVVSGHDLHDLEMLLQQTEGTGVNIYTHGEMLPAHGYPKLKKYSHLVGNYGGAWQNQRREFDEFPGAILMTTNCIQKPKESYQNRIFTTGLVAWPEVRHVGADKDFSPVIEAALQAPGFAEDGEGKTITTGFGHNAVLSAADQVIAGVKAGKIRHFFLIGGCDGAKPGRNYYTEFAEKVPNDCLILTLACGKYRFNKLEFGEIGGLPRLLDVGQCNDAYSAIQIALSLANAFECEVNDLPLSMILSWYEQKAVAILLTLLHLGIKNIKLGPSLPAFVTPPVLNALVENFNIAPVSTAEEDMRQSLA